MTEDLDLDLVVLVKGLERYVFLFAHSRRVEMLRLAGRFAADPDLSFTWYDASILCQKVRSLNDEEGDEIPLGR